MFDIGVEQAVGLAYCQATDETMDLPGFNRLMTMLGNQAEPSPVSAVFSSFLIRTALKSNEIRCDIVAG